MSDKIGDDIGLLISWAIVFFFAYNLAWGMALRDGFKRGLAIESDDSAYGYEWIEKGN